MAMIILDKCRGKGSCFKKPAYRSTLRSQVLKPEKGLGELLTLPWYLPEPWSRHRLWAGPLSRCQNNIFISTVTKHTFG